jgi:hypothetical protein
MHFNTVESRDDVAPVSVIVLTLNEELNIVDELLTREKVAALLALRMY